MKRLLPALLASLPLAAPAQEAAPVLQEDPRAARFHEVERGLWMGFEVGFVGFAKTPTADASKFPYAQAGGGFASGLGVGVSLGYDIGSRVALSLFALGSDARASASYGSFDVLAAGVDLRIAPLAWRDAQGVERLFGYVHVRGGALRSHPAALFDTSDFLFGGGVGFEYFTRLRHFSVGAAVDGIYVGKVKVPGFAVTPTLRYTF
jgi:hypothetical protein